MTLDTRTPAEIAYDAERDGTPITGVRDNTPNGRSGLTHAQIGNLWLTAQNDPDLFSVDELDDDEPKATGNRTLQLHDVTIAQLNALRAVLATDIPEQMIAAAYAYERGDVAPPPPPALDKPLHGFRGVLVSPDVANSNELVAPPRVERVGGVLTARLGAKSDAAWAADSEEQQFNPRRRVVEIARLHARGLVILDVGDEVLVMSAAEYTRQLPDEAPAVRVEHLWYDAEGDATHEPGDRLMYTAYVLGEGDGKAEISFRVDGHDESPDVYMFGRDGVYIAEVLATLPNLMTLLKDPRVLAHLADYSARLKRAA